MSTLGDRVKEARQGARLSQGALAARIGVKQSSISELERGDSRETAHIVKIALATRFSAYWLETGKGPKKQSELEAVFLSLPENEQRATLAFIKTLRGLPAA